MTKPRIKIFRRDGHIWYRCETWHGAKIQIGVGITPLDAYNNWFDDDIPF